MKTITAGSLKLSAHDMCFDINYMPYFVIKKAVTKVDILNRYSLLFQSGTPVSCDLLITPLV